METSFRKILFIGHEASQTGAPIIALSLLKWIHQQGNIKIYILLERGGVLLSEYEQLGQTFVWRKRPKFFDRKKSQLFKHLRIKRDNSIQKEILKAIKASDCDILFVNSIASSSLAYRAKEELGIPMITWVHELEKVISRYWTKQFQDKFVESCEHFIAVSEFAQLSLSEKNGVPTDKTSLIYGFLPKTPEIPGVKPIKKELGIPEDAFVVGLSGVMTWWKGFDLLPHLVVEVKKKASAQDIHFLWVGGRKRDSDYSKTLLVAEELGVTNQIHIIEHQPNPAQYYAVFDIFVMLSKEDTFPLVCLENAYLGKPIICFKESGGMPEFVESDAGFVVPFLDVSAMAEKIIYLSEEKPEIERLGQNASRKVKEKFNVENSGEQILKAIEKYSK